MKNKIKALIEKYEKIIEEEKKYSLMYEEIDNTEMMYACIDKARYYQKIVNDLKGILK